MKRIYVSYILLTLTALICSVQFIYVIKSCDNFTYNICKIEEKYNKKDYKEARKICEEALKKWDSRVKYTDMFLNHSSVDDIKINFDKLNINIKMQEDSEVISLCSELKNQFQALRNSEYPRAENII